MKARSECVYRAPLPPRRRKKRTPEDVLTARLKKYEELLRENGIRIDSSNDADGATTAKRSAGSGPDTDHFATGEEVEGAEVLAGSGARFTVPERPKGRLISEEGRSRYFDSYDLLPVITLIKH